MLANWQRDGLNIKVLTLKIEDSNGTKPASMEGANHWRDAYNLSPPPLSASICAEVTKLPSISSRSIASRRRGRPPCSIATPQLFDARARLDHLWRCADGPWTADPARA